MKKIWKKTIALAVTAALSISLAACGKDDTPDVSGNEYVYVPEYQTIAVGENTYMYDIRLADNRLYYSSNRFDEETGTYANIMAYRELNDLQNEQKMVVPELEVENMETNMDSYTTDAQGNQYVLWTVYPMYVEGQEYDDSGYKTYLCKYDSNMNLLFSQDIKGALEENTYIYEIVADGQGNVYANTQNAIYVFDTEGAFKKKISLSVDWIEDIFMTADGKIMIRYYGMTGVELAEIDVAAGALGQTYSKIPEGNGKIKSGDSGKLLISGSTQLYEYDMATQESTSILNWTDSNINGNDLQDFCFLEDGRIATYSRSDSGNPEIAFLTKTKASELPETEEIILATLYEGDYDMLKSVISFNKANPQYKVKIKHYVDNYTEWTENTYSDAIARMNADLASKDCPDIFDISSIDWNHLIANNLLEDLTPYMEKSTIANVAVFEPSVLKAYNFDGKQLTIPSSFGISTLMGKTSVVGDKAGWTMKDMMELAKKNPEADLMRYMDKSSALSLCLMYSSDSFINYADKTCSFNSPAFIEILEFANQFDMEMEDSDESFPTLIQQNKILLADVHFSDVQNFQMYNLMFEEDAICIGYPTVDGSAGTFIQGYGLLGISSQSDHKEGAWKFVESTLTPNTEHMWNFPSRKDELEAMFEEAMTPSYQMDWDGNIVKDENGNPIEDPKTTWGYDDWQADIYAATQEEVDAIREMIGMAKLSSFSDQTIFQIIAEEVKPYFEGQKNAQAVADSIQSRVGLYIMEGN